MEMANVLAQWGYKGEVTMSCYDEDSYYDSKNEKNYTKALEGEELHSKFHWIFIKNKESILMD